jgi:N-methylhydantoinase A/oxoprolinase/acetone carboxylase beta subunit
MGAVLIRAAHSSNIKERRDCSTALFDPAGEMVMQAEHIPVHLGAMPDEPVDVVAVRVTATVEVASPELREEPGTGAGPAEEREARFGDDAVTVPVYDRATLGAGDELHGPAIVELAEATCVVRPGWGGRIDDTGTMVLTR